MRALIVHCHPRAESYTAAVRDRVIESLSQLDAEIRVIDLYREGFDPALSARELDDYLDTEKNVTGIKEHTDAIGWCDTLIFVYPTWWYGIPAMLKGWLDRVLVPGVAFQMPEPDGDIRPALTHITRLGVFTTCGASRWLTAWIGAPGKRTLLRGVRILCARGCRTTFAAHYLMDSATQRSRAVHLDRVARQVKRWAR